MAKAKVRRFGWKRQNPDQRDYIYSSPRPTAALPKKVDLWEKLKGRQPIDPNLNQGDLGSCGPHTVVVHLATNALRAGVAKPILQSRLFVYYNTRSLMGTVSYDSGVDNRSMLKAVNKYGTCDEKLCPYVIGKFKAKPSAAAFNAAKKNLVSVYRAVPQTLQAMRQCLADGNPFIFGFSVYESFMSAAVEATGKVPMPKRNESLLGGHDILIYGYDDVRQVFLAGNEWGEEWGDGGNCTIPYAYATDPNLSGDFWTIGSPTAPAVDPKPLPKLDVERELSQMGLLLANVRAKLGIS